jgi:ABC-type glutathione transport system ATPase component
VFELKKSPTEEQPGVDIARPPMIEARELRKTYNSGKVEVEALKGVNLAVRKGGMVAIMGPSGCGKTTLLNSVSGLDDITSTAGTASRSWRSWTCPAVVLTSGSCGANPAENTAKFRRPGLARRRSPPPLV